MASALSSSVRYADFVARWDGDEFIVLLEDMDPDRLQAVAEKVLAGVNGLQLPFGENGLRLAVSIGATLSRPEEDLPELLLRGDDLLYHAKRNGRNQVNLEG